MRLELPRALKSHGFARAGSNPVPDDYVLSFLLVVVSRRQPFRRFSLLGTTVLAGLHHT